MTTALDLTKQRIVVTGGGGFLGRQVVAQLCQAGADRSKITVPRSRECDLRQLSHCERVVD
ncbi:MAG: GDP-L-fucose synthase, partial [Stenomitos rutilans HA7619-LM2]|nr:GDP-L-fucose synthase [Stenomitos rutilans HA7619-LM2]